MEILEGQLPDQNKEWFVLYVRTPDAPLAHTWDLAVLLAQAENGSLILVVVIEEDTEQQRAAAREAIREAEKDLDNVCGFYSIITTHESYRSSINKFVRDYNVDILVDDIGDPIHHDLQ